MKTLCQLFVKEIEIGSVIKVDFKFRNLKNHRGK